MNRRMGERRGKPRFEIVGGDLWGRLDATAPLLLRNIGHHGALVQAPMALTPGSRQTLAVNVDGHEQYAVVRVTRCVEEASARGSYAVGLEFVTLTAQLRGVIDTLLLSGGAEAT
jgi:hypothetical protein